MGLSQLMMFFLAGSSRSKFSPDSLFETAARWIIALCKELASSTLKDMELGGCKLELSVDFQFPRATLTVSIQA